ERQLPKLSDCTQNQQLAGKAAKNRGQANQGVGGGPVKQRSAPGRTRRSPAVTAQRDAETSDLDQIVAGLEGLLQTVRSRDVPGLASEVAKPGGHWNYRLFRHTDPDGEHFYQIHEAYYADGKVDRWTDE